MTRDDRKESAMADDDNTVRVFVTEDGPREGRPDGPVMQDLTDWERVDAMTDEEALQAARADPDAQPLAA